MERDRLFSLILMPLSVCISLTGCDRLVAPRSHGVIAAKAPPTFLSPSQREGAQVTHVFTITNPSRTNSMLLSYKGASCGCTRPAFHERTIQPGLAAQFPVTVQLSYKSTVDRQSVLLSTNLAELPQISLVLEVQAFARVQFESFEKLQSLIVSPGKQRDLTGEVIINQPLDAPVGCLAVSSSCIGVNATIDIASRKERLLDVAREIRVPCRLTIVAPSIDDGVYDRDMYSGDLTIQYDSETYSERIDWKPQQFVETNPKSVFVIAPRRASSFSKDVRIKSSDNFRVTAFECSESFVRIE